MKSFSLFKYFIRVILIIKASQKWLPEVSGFNKDMPNKGYAGKFGKPIIGLKISGGKEYRVHILCGEWLPAVRGNDINDYTNGYAGNGKIIDGVAISDVKSYLVHYKGIWSPVKSQYNINNQNGYAGSFGNPIDAVMIKERTYAVLINDENSESSNLKYFEISITRNEFKYEIAKNITEYVNSSQIIIGSDFKKVISYSDDMNSEEQIESGKSSIDLGNCIQIIKNYYDISDDEKLIIVNTEEKYNKLRKIKYDENSSLDLGKNIQIEVYNTSGKQLDLSICKEEIKVMKYIGDAEELDFLLAESLSKQGIDVFNRNDKFFNDICHPNRIESKDIILKDRVSDIYQNVIICQEGCIYKDINFDSKIADCVCD